MRAMSAPCSFTKGPTMTPLPLDLLITAGFQRWRVPSGWSRSSAPIFRTSSRESSLSPISRRIRVGSGRRTVFPSTSTGPKSVQARTMPWVKSPWKGSSTFTIPRSRRNLVKKRL